MQHEVAVRDISALTVSRIGRIERCAAVPGVLVQDASGETIEPVDRFLRSLVAGDLAPTTVYSYATALLRWWRFLAAVEVAWDRATRVEVRDFVLWLRATRVTPTGRVDGGGRVGFASATINHNLTVLRCFYDDRSAAGSGPILNPVPSVRPGDRERRHAAHPEIAALPDSAAGRATGLLIDLLGAGDARDRLKFATDHVADEFGGGDPAEIAAALADLRELFGSNDASQVFQEGDDRFHIVTSGPVMDLMLSVGFDGPHAERVVCLGVTE